MQFITSCLCGGIGECAIAFGITAIGSGIGATIAKIQNRRRKSSAAYHMFGTVNLSQPQTRLDVFHSRMDRVESLIRKVSR